VLCANLEVLHKMAEVLLEKEVLEGLEIDEIIKNFGKGNGALRNEPQTAAGASSW